MGHIFCVTQMWIYNYLERPDQVTESNRFGHIWDMDILHVYLSISHKYEELWKYVIFNRTCAK